MAIVEPKILIVEDDAPIRKFLHSSLSAAGYRLIEAETGLRAIRLATQQPPDLVILDLGLPDIDGRDVLKQLREWLTVPILILSARDQEKEKVAALDAGADDYLTKPFGTDELLARIRVALRHATRKSDSTESSIYKDEYLSIDLNLREIRANGEDIHLTPLEFKLLNALIRHAGKVLTQKFLMNEVWGPMQHEPHHLRVLMATLRKKIEIDSTQPVYLLTEQGVGYRFQVQL